MEHVESIIKSILERQKREGLITDEEFKSIYDYHGDIGHCDICGRLLPIGRGENFNWDEDKELWECVYCEE